MRLMRQNSARMEVKMRKIKETWKNLPETVAVTKTDGLLLFLITFLTGIILGMLCSPRKHVTFGCNNGNTTTNCWDDDCWEDEETI